MEMRESDRDLLLLHYTPLRVPPCATSPGKSKLYMETMDPGQLF